MVQGTSSFAGKSLVAAALCRIFAQRGFKVAPFKSQNTSLNSSVTPDGSEIARSQALQALAAGVEAKSAMNPILLKPMGESRSQIVVRGRPYKDVEAWDYYREFAITKGLEVVKEAYAELAKDHDIIVMEGAGSPAEINLYDRDIANMKAADVADAPVILVADIDRGGVFASIHGTLELLAEEHRARVGGIIINKFRGDISILEPGIEEIEKLTGVPVLGVLPFIPDLKLPEEDSQGLGSGAGEGADIAVIRLPRISNFTDLDPLKYEGARVRFVETPDEMGRPDAVIVPGTKDTMKDLAWMREKGFHDVLKGLKGELPIIGICGGYQIIGGTVEEDGSVEEGLGLLDVKTVFAGYEKTTTQVEGEVTASRGLFKGLEGVGVTGYEIHMGKTTLGEKALPALSIGHPEGATDEKGTVFGTYLHGIFDSPGFRSGFLEAIGGTKKGNGKRTNDIWDENLNLLSRTFLDHVDMDALGDIVGV
jgi:adenosylcobyric acid synthase